MNRISEQGIPDGAKLIYKGRNEVYRMPVKPVTDISEISIKAYCVPNIVNRVVYGHFREGKARRAYNNALRLLESGVNTAKPIAFIEHYNGVLYDKSYFICEQLSDDWRMLRGAHLWPDFDEVAEALARFMLELRTKQIYMKDFSPGNVLMRRKPDGQIEFAMIDINRMEFDVADHSRYITNFNAIFDTVAAVTTLAKKFAKVSGVEAGSEEESRFVAAAVESFKSKVISRVRRHQLKHVLFGKPIDPNMPRL